MSTRLSAILLVGAALSGCSDSTGPADGRFRAQIRGERVDDLSGSASASREFIEAFPELRFAIQMQAPRGDTLRTLVIRCPGEQPPTPGDYTLSSTGEDCLATYARTLSPPTDGLSLLEIASSATGILTIGSADPGQVAGSFTFTAPLYVVADSVGTLEVGGTFSASLR